VRGISVERLSKRYGERPALREVSFAVAPGEVVGLLGPNGAGKSTALGVLATLRAFDSGDVVVAGVSLPAGASEVRRRLGLVPQREALYPSLTARENLRFFARARSLRTGSAIDSLLARAGLAERADEPIERFSVGMCRRLNFACGLLGEPEVLLLDEPTVGVDPQSRESLYGLVGELAASGATILYSTHMMEEAARLCARVVLLDEGRVVANGTQAELVRQAGLVPELTLRSTGRLPSGLCDAVHGVRLLEERDGVARIAVDDPAAAPAVVAAADRAGAALREIALHEPDLADVFFSLTGRGLRDREDA